MARKSPPVVQYVGLALLFALAATYHVRAVMYAFPNYFHLTTVGFPFQLIYEKGRPVLTFATQPAQAAGLRDGDVLISINDRPLTGLAIFGEAMRLAKPGDIVTVATERPAGTGLHRVALRLEAARAPSLSLAFASIFAIKLVVPTFALLLGFWVAAVRPKDPSAWCLCVIMLFFSTFFSAGLESWGPVRDIAVFYRTAVSNSWPIFMLLFGSFFPEPFKENDARWWKWSKRVIIAILVAFSILNITASVGEIESYASVAALSAGLARWGLFDFAVTFMAIGTFFASIAVKLRRAVTPDAKRRLRLLYTGSSLSMAPACLMFIVQAIHGGELEQVFPEWVVLSALSLMLFFPLTLAYVIVVHRAMDVRVVIRQGLQYALARSGIRVLQILLTIAVVFSVVIFSRSRQLSLPKEITTISLGVLAVIGLRRIGEALRQWIDRRFFRDAYNAEQILEGLSEEVRTIVERRPLLERVATRISESLHVPKVAVLLEEHGKYRPAFALGYTGSLDAELLDSSMTVRRLKREAAPERIYFNDEKSWVNGPELAAEERQKLAALQPQVLLPLNVKEKLLGIISLGEKRAEAPYSGTDLRILKSVAAQTALALSNAELTTAIAEEIGRREKLNREIEIAREVQERLFPQHLPPIAGLDYFGRCRTALGVGGDYYDFLALPEGRLGIALGDVSGKGIAAALTMASLQASLRADAMRAGDDIAGLIVRVNRMLYDASTEDRYATLFYAQYDPAGRRLCYVNAGHCPPVLVRCVADGQQIERLDQAGGTVVGLLPECAYQQAEVRLAPGDLLVIYTDGFSEAMNPSQEEWGETRLLNAVATCDGLPAKDCITRIMQAADAFAAGAPQSDDMTLVILQVL